MATYKKLAFLLMLLSVPLCAGDASFPFKTVKGTCTLLWSYSGDMQSAGSAGITVVQDVNQDGARDIVAAGFSSDGKATLFHLLSGRTGSLLRKYAIPGGSYVVGSSDFNRDRRTDLLLSAYFPKVSGDPPSAEPGFYRTSAIDAASGKVLWSRTSPKVQKDFGMSAGIAGDADEDGSPDILVTATIPGSTGGQLPVVYYLSGRDGRTLRKEAPPAGASTFFGSGVAAANLDNFDGRDLVISDMLFSPTPTSIEARIWAFSGDTGEMLWTIKGMSDALLGDNMLRVPDLNGDSVDDLAVAAPNDRSYVRGTVRAVSGSNGATLWTGAGNLPSGQLGRGLAVMRDLNGDGIAEIAAGAPAALPPILAGNVPGSFQVFSGKDGRLLTFVKEILPGPQSFSSHFGIQMAAPAGQSPNGAPDLVVAAPGYGGSGVILAFRLK